MREKILITGGAGYIGTVLTRLLLDRGYAVRTYDNLTHGGDALLPFFSNPRFEFVRADIRDEKALRTALEEADVIIHLAALVGAPACARRPQLAREVNLEAVGRMARFIRDDQLVLFGSTGSNYGALSDGVCTEDAPLNPTSLYARTKTEAEKIMLNECNAIAYRFATAFGLSPRMRLDLMVNDFVCKALTARHIVVYDADFMRTFIHVSDIARSFLFALENAGRMRGEAYNVGCEEMNYSKRQICHLIREKIDYDFHESDFGEDADSRNYFVSYGKIVSLGYKTEIGIAEGIDELIRGIPALDTRSPYTNV